jgi:hypothetical protein
VRCLLLHVGLATLAACHGGSSGTLPAGDDASALDASVDRSHPVPSDDSGDEPPPVTGPARLSQTGLYADFASRTLSAGILSYLPRYELWSDGAQKKRYLQLPAGGQIDTAHADNWTFPVNTKVWKEFDVGGKVVETRLLWKQPTGWWKVAYEWLADGSDAVAVPNGDPNALGTSHDVPSQQDCHNCHDSVADVLIGVSAMQLGASDGDGSLANLVAAGAISQPLPKATFDVPGTGVVRDALGYMHGNCGHCHSDISPVKYQTPLRLRILVTDTDPLLTDAYTTTIDQKDVHGFDTDAGPVTISVVPGDPEHSELWWRMTQRGDLGMPHICTKVVDAAGTATIHDWILQMSQTGDAGSGGG